MIKTTSGFENPESQERTILEENYIFKRHELEIFCEAYAIRKMAADIINAAPPKFDEFMTEWEGRE